MTPSIGSPVVHFEIGCKDLEGTTAFYTKLFGWTTTPTSHAALLETHSPKGIPGHITALGYEPHQYVMFYIEVGEIGEILTQIEAAGGKKWMAPQPFTLCSPPSNELVAFTISFVSTKPNTKSALKAHYTSVHTFRFETTFYHFSTFT